MKTITFLRTMALMAGLMLLTIFVTGQESIIYTVGFESAEGFTASTVYNNTTIKYDGPVGEQWGTYYGTASTTSPISGSQSMQMRWYTTAPGNLGYTFTNFDLPDVTKVTFLAANTLGLNVIASYSIDGGVSYTGHETITVTGTPVLYTYNISSTGEFDNVRIKLQISLPTPTPTNTSRLYIDDLSVYGITGGTPTVSTPFFTPPAGNFYASQNVTIETTTEDATIYYTTDGTDPDDNSTEYMGPLTVITNTTLKARAYKAGYDPSAIATAIYLFPVINDVADISALRLGATDGTVYRLLGEAVLTFKTASRNAKYIQDASGAVLIDDPSNKITTTYNILDGITGITGTLGLYESMLQFTPVMDPGPATSNGNVVVPVEVTLSDLDSTYQAKLVKVNNVTITGVGNFATGTSYTINDPSGSAVLRTAYPDLNYIGSPIPSIQQNLTGVVLQYQTTLQLVPRSLSDFENVATTVDPPGSFAADAVSSYQIDLDFKDNESGNDVVIAYNATGIFSAPDGSPPALNQPFAGGTLFYVGVESPQSHTGLSQGQTVYYRAWSYDGSSYSAGLDANATTQVIEPSNHVTNFSAIANSSSSITVTWVDSDASAYLIKGSDVSFENIIAPIDGTFQTDGALIKNVAAGIQSHEFTGLTGSTEYFFKIFPYNGTGVNVNYKTDGVVPQANATTLDPPVAPVVFTQWDFEADPLLPSVNSPSPSMGTGVASIIGSMGTITRGTGSLTGCSQLTGTGAWAFGSVNPGTNESSGAQFMVATTGYENIVFTYDQRFSNSSTRTVRIQYTLNGTTWINLDVSELNYISGCAGRGGIDLGRIDIGDPVGTNVSDAWSRRTIDFSGISETNNNPNFGIRIFAAHYANTGEFRQANSVTTVATAGTWRFDNVTFSGFAVEVDPPVKLVISDINGGNSPAMNTGFNVTVQSQNSENVPSVVTEDTEVTLSLASGTGQLGGTLVGTILNGESSVTFTNITYDIAETGVSITASATDGMALNPDTSAPFEVISPATQLAFVGFPVSGDENSAIATFTVEARRSNNTLDPNFTGTITLSKLSGPGNIGGTLGKDAVNGVATFNDITFDAPGDYSCAADAIGLTQALSASITISPAPVIVGLIVPLFIGADNPTNNRVPFAFRAKFENLKPNSTYKYINQVVIGIDLPDAGGAGNAIYVTESGTFFRATSTSFTTVGQHSEFTTDTEGAFTGWFITEPTTNARFTPGNQVFIRVRLNDGAGGTSAAHFLTISDAITVLGFGIDAEATKGTAIRATSLASAKNFVFLYDNAARDGRPIYGSSIEAVGIDFSSISNYSAFYRNDVSGVAGAWGGIVPNVNANGVRFIEERGLSSGNVVNTYTSADGMWGQTNTVNPSGGKDDVLVIDLIPTTPPETLSLTDEIYGEGPAVCLAATQTITVMNSVFQTGSAVTLVAGVNILLLDGTTIQEGANFRAWIDTEGNYCDQPKSLIAAKNDPLIRDISVTDAALKLYPNPTTGFLTLEIPAQASSQNLIIEIYGAIGERIMQVETRDQYNFTLDVSSLPRGMYIVRVLIGNEMHTGKIMKQ